MAAAGRTILFSSHILEEVERLADDVLVVFAGRLAASGDFREIRRLMTDRPHTFTVRSSDDRRLAAALVASASVFGVELVDGTADRPGIASSRPSPLAAPGGARRRASRSSSCGRPTSRSRASSPTWCADELADHRGDASRRCWAGGGRSSSVLLALLPVLHRARSSGSAGPRSTARCVDRGPARRRSWSRRCCRCVALVFGTGGAGSRARGRHGRLPAREADRALADRRRRRPRSPPRSRWPWSVPATLVAGLIVGSGRGGESGRPRLRGGGGPGIASSIRRGFVALSVVTSRALIAGLAVRLHLGGTAGRPVRRNARCSASASTFSRSPAGWPAATAGSITSSVDADRPCSWPWLFAVATVIAIRRLAAWEVRTAE